MKKLMNPALPIAGAVALGFLLAAGCGGGGSTKSTPTPSAATKPAEKPAEAAPVPTDAAAATPTDAAAVPAEAAAAPAAGGEPTQEARDFFKLRCATCHGEQGHGDGIAAVALTTKPRDFGDSAWQASVTDEHIAKTIVEGGASVGKSPLMAPNPDLKDKPELVKGLTALVRSLKVS